MSDFWNRQKKYWFTKIRQLKGTPNSIATGVACGVAVSFTPFVGMHLVLAMFSAWIGGGNIVASALGTAIGNPWTFPFIWVSILYTGKKFLGRGYEALVDINFSDLFTKAFDALINFKFENFLSDVWPILYPMLVGCIPYVVLSWWISYLLVKNILLKRKKNYKK